MRVHAAKISLAVLLLTGAGGSFCAAGESGITYRSQAGIPLRAGNTLRRFEQFLKEIFPRTLWKKSPLTIDITGRGTPLGYVPGERIEADHFRLERMTLEVLSETGSAMLRALGRAPAGYKLPLFLCGVFRHRERGAQRECRFLGNNRRLRSVESLLRQGSMPQLQILLTHRPDEWDSIENEWFDDHSRLLWEMLKSRNFKGSPAALESAVRKLLAEKREYTVLTPLIWGAFNPLPPEHAERELDAMLKIRIPTLDHNNEPTALMETVSAAQLPAKMVKHPQKMEIMSQFASALLRNAVRLPRQLRGDCRKVHDEALRLGRNPAGGAAFIEALKQLERTCKLYRARAEFLDRCQNETAHPLRMWKNSCRVNGLPGAIVAPECRRFLERSEEYYTGS